MTPTMTERPDRLAIPGAKSLLGLVIRISVSCLVAAAIMLMAEYAFASRGDTDKLLNAATWAAIDNTDSWTRATIQSISNHMSELEKARDISDFCPGYSRARKRERFACWLRLVGGVVRYESNYKPDDLFREPNGSYSVGLMALSPNECNNAPTIRSLKKAVPNLVCGINMMAELIARDGFIDGPKSARGAATYWSTLREPYSYGHMKLGKKDKISALTRTYREY